MKAGVYNSMNQTLLALALRPSLTINRRGMAPTSETDMEEIIMQNKNKMGSDNSELYSLRLFFFLCKNLML